jgi:isopenicillin N synthase-like dioxygenase
MWAVKNHGISEEVIALALDSMKTYFALPLETKIEA